MLCRPAAAQHQHQPAQSPRRQQQQHGPHAPQLPYRPHKAAAPGQGQQAQQTGQAPALQRVEPIEDKDAEAFITALLAVKPPMSKIVHCTGVQPQVCSIQRAMHGHDAHQEEKEREKGAPGYVCVWVKQTISVPDGTNTLAMFHKPSGTHCFGLHGWQAQHAPMLAVPVLAEEHPLREPAASAPSAPPFDTQAFYAASPSSSSGRGGGAGKELWEDDVIAAGKWEEPPQVTSLCYLCWNQHPPVGCAALCNVEADKRGNSRSVTFGLPFTVRFALEVRGSSPEKGEATPFLAFKPTMSALKDV